MNFIVLKLTHMPGDYVLELFAGTASTALACIQHGRQYIGAEIDPDLAKDALERLERRMVAHLNNQSAAVAHSSVILEDHNTPPDVAEDDTLDDLCQRVQSERERDRDR